MKVKTSGARDGAVEISARVTCEKSNLPDLLSGSVYAVAESRLAVLRRDGKRGLSSDAPANRDVHARRAKFFSPEIFGPSK
jgi:hypothetical protein